MNQVVSQLSSKPVHCELCERAETLTRHHLIPRTHHRRKIFVKRFTKQQMTNSILWLCRPCHSHIHSSFSERDLGLQYSSREALLNCQEITEFVDWIKAKPAGFKPKSNRKRW
ncbi:hypothetical protein [Spartinivicinus poritis]|uniref:HNH endonuclease n=1 Tax=Spartinivicinus poritis TaxID=2994640 RepID=A0ABT5UIB9_9GAMM|nr:hypothetical protein [Spartinivicinus sp. A2-2]MDE1465960.1 hypothetical protein [Spartinivicinus sp. A2-2]